MRYNFTISPFSVCVCYSLALFRTLSNFLPVHLHFCDCVEHNDAEHGIPSDVAHSADGRYLLKLKQGVSNAISHCPQLFFPFASIHLYHYIFPLFIRLKLTACMKQCPFRKANSSSASQQIPPISFCRHFVAVFQGFANCPNFERDQFSPRPPTFFL